MNKTEKISLELNRVFKFAAVLCFIFMVAYLIYGIIVSPDLGLFYEEASIYDGEWIRENADGSEAVYFMPMTLTLAEGEVATFYTILPDTVDDGMYLAFNTGKCFTVYVEGKKIYEFDNRMTKLPGHITKTVIIPIQLTETYAGKKLAIDFYDGIYDRSTVNAVYYGSLMGIFILLIKNYALQLVLAILLSFAALLTMGIFGFIERKEEREVPLVYLAEGVLLICLWVIFDSPLFQLIFRVFFVDGVLGFMLVIIMGYPFLLYFDSINEYKNHRIFSLCEKIIIINFIVLTILHMTGIQSYDRALVYIDTMLLIYILVIIVFTIRNYFRKKDKQHRNVIIGMIALAVFSVGEIVVTLLYTIFPFKLDIGGAFVLLGLILLLFFAILDQIKVLEKLKKETQNALAATKAKSDFLANMSHEIRTPINAIMGMNEMIIRETDQDNIREYAKDISSASENLLEIINDILDFSKIESGKLELICDNYDLGELICDVTNLVNMKAENKGLKFNISVDENLPSILYGDDKRVREVITNILNNAVKYTEEGYVSLNVAGEKFGKNVLLRINIEDSGQGIRKEDIDSIFEGFSQVNVKKNKHIEGTGLGLSITKHLVELMGGSISVTSEFGKGSTFSLVLPQEVISSEKMGDYHTHKHFSTKDSGNRLQEMDIPSARILVVDDTALNLKVISKILAKTKANVFCASSGKEMLELIQENSYDLILLDHMMPNMDGIEALKLSRTMKNNKCKDVAVIALTANAIVGAREMYLEAGFDDYLSKPIRINELCDVLEKYIQ